MTHFYGDGIVHRAPPPCICYVGGRDFPVDRMLASDPAACGSHLHISHCVWFIYSRACVLARAKRENIHFWQNGRATSWTTSPWCAMNSGGLSDS